MGNVRGDAMRKRGYKCLRYLIVMGKTEKLIKQARRAKLSLRGDSHEANR